MDHSITCRHCGYWFEWIWDKPDDCPNCGEDLNSSQLYKTCSNCGHRFEWDGDEPDTCPECKEAL